MLLKTLLALAVGDEEAVREGCDWIHHFGQIDEARLRVYRCLDHLLQLAEATDVDHYREALTGLFGAVTLERASALLARRERFFGIDAPGIALKRCELHGRLLDAYAKARLRLSTV